MQYLAPGLTFNNSPWDNLNNDRILTHRRLFESDSNNGPFPGLCNLGQMKATPVQVSNFWSPGGCNIWSSAPGLLTSTMAQEITWIVAAFWPRRLFESNSIYGFSPGCSNLGTRKIITACTIAALLITWFFPPKCSEASFNRAQSVKKNCLNDTSTSPVLFK